MMIAHLHEPPPSAAALQPRERGIVLRSRSFQIRLTARPPVHSREENGSPCCARAVLAIACRARIECDLETAVRESGETMRAFHRWSICSHDDGPQARARLRRKVLIAEKTREMSKGTFK